MFTRNFVFVFTSPVGRLYPSDVFSTRVPILCINTSASGCILYRAREWILIQNEWIVMRAWASSARARSHHNSRVLYHDSRARDAKYNHDARVLIRVYRQLGKLKAQCLITCRRAWQALRRACVNTSIRLPIVSPLMYFNCCDVTVIVITENVSSESRAYLVFSACVFYVSTL